MNPLVAIIGAGPAGLMAAETCAEAGLAVDVYDAMPSVGRKFLLAGIGGLNLTHAEPLDKFVARYDERSEQVAQWLEMMNPQALRDWAHALGVETFVGSSNRVFPKEMKAAPLLRAWLHRLRSLGVRFHPRHRWQGWNADGALLFNAPEGDIAVKSQATVLACGGASWQRLGSDGAWVPWLRERSIDVAPLIPMNCGFDVEGGWSTHLQERFAGAPLKNVALHFQFADRAPFRQISECVVTKAGLEGSLVYAASGLIRDEILRTGQAVIHIDLLPQRSHDWVRREVAHPRGSRSLSTHLKSRLNIHGVSAALLHELSSKEQMYGATQLANAIKSLPITLVRPRPIDEAISTGGGVKLEALTNDLMCKALPSVFCAGEMLDWEAPTGGYLLTACFASGQVAGRGVISRLQAHSWSVRY